MDDALVLMPATVHALQWIASQPCDFVYEESESAELETTETEWRWKKEDVEKKLDSYIFLGFYFTTTDIVTLMAYHDVHHPSVSSCRHYSTPFTYLKNAR